MAALTVATGHTGSADGAGPDGPSPARPAGPAASDRSGAGARVDRTMGTALAHMLRTDAETTDGPEIRTGPPSALRSLSWSPGDHDRPDRRRPERDRDRSPGRDQNGEMPDRQRGGRATGPDFRVNRPQVDQARMVASRLATTGKPVSRRALRRGGVRGSNEALNALARMINSEIAGAAPPRARTG
jgi:hypothetical protein